MSIVRPLVALVLVGAAAGAASAAQPVFSEQTVAAGVNVAHQAPGIDLLMDDMPAGGVAADFNGDGWMDLFVAGGQTDTLFLNDQDGTFTNATAASGITGGSISAAAGDTDGDGDIDLFVTRKDSLHVLYVNQGGGVFQAVVDPDFANAGAVGAPALGAAFGDYDGDGDLDLFVSAYQGGTSGIEIPSRLFRNDGGNSFTDVTAAIGLFTGATSLPVSYVSGFFPRFVDLDADFDPELLLINDFGTTLYFENDGDGTFTDVTNAAIPEIRADTAFMMGLAVGDFNGDLGLDLFMTNVAGDGIRNQLFMRTGEHEYDEVAAAAGVDEGGWGWATVPVDVNHDGLLDIVETNGWGTAQWENHQSYMWMNDGNGAFTDVAIACGFVNYGQGRGMLNFDYDNDGDQDVVIFENQGPLRLYRNEVIESGAMDANWLRVFLDRGGDTSAPPQGQDARVVITVDGAQQIRQMDSATTYLSQSEPSAHFGIGSATVIDEIRVTWPDGALSVRTNVAANQTMTIVKGPPADLNGDGMVGSADLALLLGAWGPCPAPTPCGADLDGDGDVGSADLALLLGAWS